MTVIRLFSVIAAALVALALAAPGLASSSRTADAKSWCAWMIHVNTKYSLMKNRHYLPESEMSVARWKGVIDTTLAQQKHYIAIAPPSLRKTLTHEIAYYARVKQKGYILTKAKLGTFTLAELGQVVDFQRTQCRIRFPPEK